MASPPPSDGLMAPSSPVTMPPPSSPLQEQSPASKRPRRETRKPVLTPRKLARFFTPQSQRTSSMPMPRPRRRILQETNEGALNIQSSPPTFSQEKPDALPSTDDLDVVTATNPHPTPASRKRKRQQAVGPISPSPALTSTSLFVDDNEEIQGVDQAPTAPPMRRLRFNTPPSTFDGPSRIVNQDSNTSGITQCHGEASPPLRNLLAVDSLEPLFPPARPTTDGLRHQSQAMTVEPQADFGLSRCTLTETGSEATGSDHSRQLQQNINRSRSTLVRNLTSTPA